MKLNPTINLLAAALLISSSANLFAADEPAKPAAAPGPSPAKQAIAVRKAAFTLIGNNFKPIGDALQGKAEYNQADIKKRAERVAFLTEFLEGTFPEDSNVGAPDSKAKPEIWEKKAEFDKLLKEFNTNAKTLAQVAATETTASDKFKAAAKAVADGCKGCHDSFKTK